jgi:hypothetical protein
MIPTLLTLAIIAAARLALTCFASWLAMRDERTEL